MAIELIDKIKQKNGQNFKLLDGKDIEGILEAEVGDSTLGDKLNSILARVNSLEQLGQFVGSYPSYQSLPGNTSEITDKYGIGATINDFATVRGGEYPESSGINSESITCWSIYEIAENGDIGWAYEFTYSADVSNKIDKVSDSKNYNVRHKCNNTQNINRLPVFKNYSVNYYV